MLLFAFIIEGSHSSTKLLSSKTFLLKFYTTAITYFSSQCTSQWCFLTHNTCVALRKFFTLGHFLADCYVNEVFVIFTIKPDILQGFTSAK